MKAYSGRANGAQVVFEEEVASFESGPEALDWFGSEAARVLVDEADDLPPLRRRGLTAYVEVRDGERGEAPLARAEMPCSAMYDVDELWRAAGDPGNGGRVCASFTVGGVAVGPAWHGSRRSVAEAYARCFVGKAGADVSASLWERSDDDVFAAWVWTDPDDGRRMISRWY